MDAIVPLINGISRVIDYYASRNSGESIERILITGLGADFKGMSELLAQEVNMPVSVLKDAAGWNLMRNFKNECFSEYIACVGAAVAPLDFKQEAEKRGKEKKGKAGSNAKGEQTGRPLLTVSLALVLWRQPLWRRFRWSVMQS